MAKTKFNMKLRKIGTKEVFTKEIEGYEFEYKGIELVIHKAIDSKTEWTASEPNTGMKIVSCPIYSKRDTIQEVKDRIDSYTSEKFKAVIDQAIANLK